jgi:DNA-binding GntR family transcriptional regulator
MTTPDAAWLVVARDLSQRINSGEIPVGQSIPSREQMRQRYRVAESTIRRAVTHLSSAGVLKGEQGRGVYVQRLPTAQDLETRLTVDQRVVELEAQVAELQARVDALESGTDSELRAQVGELQAQLLDLYSRTGTPRPSRRPESTRRKRTG